MKRLNRVLNVSWTDVKGIQNFTWGIYLVEYKDKIYTALDMGEGKIDLVAEHKDIESGIEALTNNINDVGKQL